MRNSIIFILITALLVVAPTALAQTIRCHSGAVLYKVSDSYASIITKPHDRRYCDYTQRVVNTITLDSSMELNVAGFFNRIYKPEYDSYLVQFNGAYYLVDSADVIDNSLLFVENEKIQKFYAELQSSLAPITESMNELATLASSEITRIKNRRDTISYYIKKRHNAIEEYYRDSLQSIVDKRNTEKEKEAYNAISDWEKNHSPAAATAGKMISDLQYRLSSSNSVGGHDAIITFDNASNKTIKYFDWTARFKNSVDDFVNCEVRSSTSPFTYRGRDTGPYKPGETVGGCWENVIYNYSATNLVIDSITLTYMDGSSISFSAKTLSQLYSRPRIPEKETVKDNWHLVLGKVISQQDAVSAEYANERRVLLNEESLWQMRFNTARSILAGYFSVPSELKDDAFFLTVIPLLEANSSKGRLIQQYEDENFYNDSRRNSHKIIIR